MQEHMAELGRASPPIAVTSLSFMGVPLSEWVYAVTLLYTILLILNFLRKLFFSYRKSDKDPACAEDCPVAKRARQ